METQRATPSLIEELKGITANHHNATEVPPEQARPGRRAESRLQPSGQGHQGLLVIKVLLGPRCLGGG